MFSQFDKNTRAWLVIHIIVSVVVIAIVFATRGLLEAIAVASAAIMGGAIIAERTKSK